ncbi:HNH endonuclease [Sphingomonas sp. CFBP 13720]|uniref:HNH endonuclease n=1 Tax=Sphingomonas sp. CFBP 13720 TaxID=2775302 RepID=UPI001782435D|nr:HNH endonuclease [Sphingomonas sp. CFBP 13720]MBD8677940.1 HNH endonuclease [Sphingomonas sp. CFBP 13720]
MHLGKLTGLKPRLQTLPSRLSVPATRQERDHDRDQQGWRRWYKTARWQTLRWSVLVRDLFTCQRCQIIMSDTSQLVADHTKAHRGDEALFWDDRNLQCLCKRCHDSDKQREERRAR